jgi:MFS family permease
MEGRAVKSGTPMPVRGAQNGSMRHFWVLTWASAISKMGNTFLSLAVPWALLAHTGSPVLATVSVGMQGLPYAFSPVFGAAVDRYDHRRVFVASELTQAVAVATIPLFISANQIAVVLVLVSVVGCGTVTSNLASDYSLVPALSPLDRFGAAYSRYSAITGIARCVGPAVAGGMMAVVGPAGTLWIDAATFLVTAGVATRLPLRRRSGSRVGWRSLLATGFREFPRISGIPLLTVVLGLYYLGTGGLRAALVAIAQSTWRWSSQQAGLALAAMAAATALGAWAAGGVLLERSNRHRIGFWLAVCVAGGFAMLVPGAWVIVAGLCLLSFGEGGINVTTNEYRAEIIPDGLIGRINAIVRAVATGVVPLSALLLGLTSSLPVTSLWLAPAAAGALAAGLVWMSRRPGRTTFRTGDGVTRR